MQTAEKNAKGVQGTAEKNNSSVKTENRPSLTGKEAKNETAQNQTTAKGEESETAKAAEVQAGNSATVDNQPADTKQPAAAEVNSNEQQAEEKQPKEEAKPVLSLDAKIKAVNDLHRKTIQRLALIARLKTLEEFEVALLENNDELESNPYQGCKLIIEDDKRRQFVTNTPNLIRMVSQFIFDACESKLAEIEATINFPQA